MSDHRSARLGRLPRECYDSYEASYNRGIVFVFLITVFALWLGTAPANRRG